MEGSDLKFGEEISLRTLNHPSPPSHRGLVFSMDKRGSFERGRNIRIIQKGSSGFSLGGLESFPFFRNSRLTFPLRSLASGFSRRKDDAMVGGRMALGGQRLKSL